jgi:hypothetical protein
MDTREIEKEDDSIYFSDFLLLGKSYFSYN